MSYFQLYYNACDRLYMNKLPATTFSIPPYLLLRLTMGPRPKTPLVRYWFSTDLRGGCNSRRLGVFNTCSQEVQWQPGNKMYPKDDFFIVEKAHMGGGFGFADASMEDHVQFINQGTQDKKDQYCLTDNKGEDVSIRDKDGKTLVYDKTFKTLIAQSLQVGNMNMKAKFVLTACSMHDDNTMLFTLKIKGFNLYLCCSKEDKLTLQEKDKIVEEDKINEILFFREFQNGYTKFRSAMYPTSYICTNRYRESQPVTIKSDVNRVRIEFLVERENGEQNEGKLKIEGLAKREQENLREPQELPPYNDYVDISCTRDYADY